MTAGVSAAVSLALPLNVPRWTSPPWVNEPTATEPSIGVELLTAASGASRPPLNWRLRVRLDSDPKFHRTYGLYAELFELALSVRLDVLVRPMTLMIVGR